MCLGSCILFGEFSDLCLPIIILRCLIFRTRDYVQQNSMFATKILKDSQMFLAKKAKLSSVVLCQDNTYLNTWLSEDKYFE